jgi:hypothetical protein
MGRGKRTWNQLHNSKSVQIHMCRLRPQILRPDVGRIGGAYLRPRMPDHDVSARLVRLVGDSENKSDAEID